MIERRINLKNSLYTNVKQAATCCKKIQFLNVLKSEGGSEIGNNLKPVGSVWESIEEGIPQCVPDPDPLVILLISMDPLPRLSILKNNQVFFHIFCLQLMSTRGTYNYFFSL
jgi:hypothetical protein